MECRPPTTQRSWAQCWQDHSAPTPLFLALPKNPETNQFCAKRSRTRLNGCVKKMFLRKSRWCGRSSPADCERNGQGQIRPGDHRRPENWFHRTALALGKNLRSDQIDLAAGAGGDG